MKVRSSLTFVGMGLKPCLEGVQIILASPLPSEGGSVSGRETAMSVGHKKSGSSIHALRNPFGGDAAAEEDEEPEKEDWRLILASWWSRRVHA